MVLLRQPGTSSLQEQRPRSQAVLATPVRILSIAFNPRYDPQQPSEGRRHASNGIWPCTMHAKQIDDDNAHLSADILSCWKQAAGRRSTLAILTLQLPSANSADLIRTQIADRSVLRAEWSAADGDHTVTARLRQAAIRELDAFVDALRLLFEAIPLDSRLIEGRQVRSFQAARLTPAISTCNEIIAATLHTGKTTL
ncbi:hypothetical protein SAMN05443245_4197 [Paraburkholderia fungorum]|uniref:Uncharacterized protein n=1 Tax=Paraburkholderia fungorum TaxID=134537 RepID=A0A1H1HR52_9BURK|nr:hypothetical protein [Paraburkholderia fungorum]SDR27892.1 hypothetical protein SAMN05443245_4197 [Paraburkholderia fungorum]